MSHTLQKGSVLQERQVLQHRSEFRLAYFIHRVTEGSVLNEVRLNAIPTPFRQDGIDTLSFAFPAFEKSLVKSKELRP